MLSKVLVEASLSGVGARQGDGNLGGIKAVVVQVNDARGVIGVGDF